MFSVKPLSQQDPRWKAEHLGDSNSTFGMYGCLLTCLAMVANGFGADEDPSTLNIKMKKVGGFLGDNLRPHLLARATRGVKYQKTIMCNNPPAPIADIDAALTAGMPVVIEVDYSPDPKIQQHWILLVDKIGNDYMMLDPWPWPAQAKPMRLSRSKYAFAGGAAQTILGTIFFTGKPAVAAELQERALPPDALVVYANSDDLAMRSHPQKTDDTLIDRMPAKTKLYALEPADIARVKVGLTNTWLEVQRDEDGQKGYVYAYYLSLTPEVLPDPPVADGVAAPVPGLVYSTGDALALRSRPETIPETLIKRLPVNSQLTLLEPLEQANAKIGVEGQWLQVKDITGKEGFVAAWFVADHLQQPTLGVTASQPGTPGQPAAPASDTLIVRTTGDNLALRKEGSISPLNLIKRLPLLTELQVIEPIPAALLKIGKTGQWLNVRDIAGAEGFVAAWFVVRKPSPPSSSSQP